MNFTPNLVHTPCESNTAIARSTFPIDALPQPLHDYVIAASAAAQTSLDLAAVTCLGVCSAALAGHVRIADGAGDEQPASLFVATVTAGLRREADLFQCARQPLQTLEAEQIEAARIPRIQAQSLLRQAKIRLRQREKQAAVDHQQFRLAALDFATQVVENHVPALPRLLIDDTTTAKLSTILAEQDGRVARFSTETAASDLFSGSRSQRSLAQQALYWKGYRGEEVTIDQRAGNERPSAAPQSAAFARSPNQPWPVCGKAERVGAGECSMRSCSRCPNRRLGKCLRHLPRSQTKFANNMKHAFVRSPLSKPTSPFA